MPATLKPKSGPILCAGREQALTRLSPYLVGTIPAPIFNLKVKSLENRSIAIVFSGKATPDGELHIPPTEPKAGSTAREYETALVRVR